MVIKVDGKAKLQRFKAENVQEIQTQLTYELNSEFTKKHPITMASFYTAIISFGIGLIMLAMYDPVTVSDSFALIHFLMWSTFFFSTAVVLVAGVLTMGDHKRIKQKLEKKLFGTKNKKKHLYLFSSSYRRQDYKRDWLNEDTLTRIKSESNEIPILMMHSEEKKWYLFRGFYWFTDETYNSSDLEQLIIAEHKKRENKIKRARRGNSDELKDEKRSRKISDDTKDRVWNRDGGKCVNCGSKKNLEFDHIIPFSRGGANTYRNLQLLCEGCNRSKSNKIG